MNVGLALALSSKNKLCLTQGTALAAVAPRRVVETDDASVGSKLGRAPGLDVHPSLDAGRRHLAVEGEREDALGAVLG